VKMDPRVKTPSSALTLQFSLSKALYDGAIEAQAALGQMRAVRAQVKAVGEKAGPSAVAKALAAFDAKAAAIEGTPGGGFGGGQGGGAGDTLAGITSSLTSLVGVLQGADAAPTSQAMAAVGDRRRALVDLLGRWTAFRTTEIAAMNGQLRAAGLPELTPGR